MSILVSAVIAPRDDGIVDRSSFAATSRILPKEQPTSQAERKQTMHYTSEY